MKIANIADSATICLALTAVLLTGACGSAGPEESTELTRSVSENLIVGHFDAFTQIPNGTFTSGPAVVKNWLGYSEVFAKGGDDQIWQNVVRGSQISGWSPIPNGTFTSKPSATTENSSDHGHTWVVAKGFDNKIYLNVGVQVGLNPEVWGGWNSISATTFVSAPAIAFGNGFLYVFARQSNGVLYFAFNDVTNGYNPASWTGFSSIPGSTSGNSDVAAVYDGLAFRVVALASNSTFITTKSTGSSWTTWSQIPGGTFPFAPAIASSFLGQVDVYGVGFDGQMYFTTAASGGIAWNGFQFIPNATFTSAPAVAGGGGFGSLYFLMARGGDQAIWRSQYIKANGETP